MDRTEAMNWVLTVCSALRLSQAKSTAAIVIAALQVGRVSLAALGRQLVGVSAKHGTKRVDRYLGNQRIEISEAMRGVIPQLIRRPGRKRRPLLVALDWVEVRKFHTLSAVAVIRGRAVPLLWATYPEWELHRSQNSLEEGLIRLLKTLLPEGLTVILLADRGFGRTELARTCEELGYKYLIRIKPDVHIQVGTFRGKLCNYPVKKGIRRLLKGVRYRQKNPAQLNVVVYWKKGLPEHRDECWFLMTNLDRSAPALVNLFAQRMTIEQVFRDHKNRRNGFALRDILVKKADRFDRLLLLLTLAYILLLGLGLHAHKEYCPSNWSTNTQANQCSVFTIGLRMLNQIQVPIPQLLAALVKAIYDAAPNWG